MFIKAISMFKVEIIVLIENNTSTIFRDKNFGGYKILFDWLKLILKALLASYKVTVFNAYNFMCQSLIINLSCLQ